MSVSSESSYTRIYAAVRRIPPGSVASYGQVAREAGLPGHARQVGYALHALDDAEAPSVPWQRVVNAAGEISLRGPSDGEERQRAILEAEGIVFDDRGRIDLGRFGWRPTTSGGPDRRDPATSRTGAGRARSGRRR